MRYKIQPKVQAVSALAAGAVVAGLSYVSSGAIDWLTVGSVAAGVAFGMGFLDTETPREERLAQKKKLLLYIVLGVAVVALFVGGRLGSTTVSPVGANAFTEALQGYVIENVGRPIEGFSAPIYLNAFPALSREDFDGVATREGEYVYEDGALRFVRTEQAPITSAEEMITDAGHETLFQNVRERLGDDLSREELLSRILPTQQE